MDIDAGGVSDDAARVTLAELLVALAILAVVGLTAFTLLDEAQRAWAFGSARAETQESARAALARLAAEIRVAGHGVGTFDAVALAAPDSIVLQQDLDGDGIVAANGERVTWRLVDGILRRDAGGGLQPIINGVSVFALSYFDANGAPTTVPGTVRSVEVLLATRPSYLAAGPNASTIVTTRVRLRNR